MLYISVSILAGVCIVVSRIINFKLSERIGLLQGTLFNYVVGLFFSSVFLLISREFNSTSNQKFNSLPLWAYLGGLMGVCVVVLSSYITPKMSAFYLTLFIFIGQLFMGIIIDYLRTNILSFWKITGGFLVLAGLAYNLLLDKNNET